MDKPGFIVCQVGAREHYAVARTLHRAGLLNELITDIWVPPSSVLRNAPGHSGERLRGRYHTELSVAKVTRFTTKAIARQAVKIASKPPSRWDELIGQNRWFQAEVVRYLRASKALEKKETRPVVLAYSYAAREILALARDVGARTILVQIDGAEADEALISAQWSKRLQTMPYKAPDTYWAAWREECQFSDRILVNSEWSKQLLVRAGIDQRKLVVTPVVYDRGLSRTFGLRQYPKAFDSVRPLRVLFLGALTLRKGVLEALEAARALIDRAVHFTFVGEDSEAWASLMLRQPNITRYDRVPRSHVLQFYNDADVFLFPTHSDGFGMTQIEALEAGLPLIASRNCASIVRHGKTGLLLNEVSADEIVRAITHCLAHPEDLPTMSAAALRDASDFARQSSAIFLDVVREIALNH